MLDTLNSLILSMPAHPVSSGSYLAIAFTFAFTFALSPVLLLGRYLDGRGRA